MVYVLLTNDDGIDAPGMTAMVQAAGQLASPDGAVDVRVVAPARNQSASGHKKTLFQDIPYEMRTLANGVIGVAVDGSPADCIAVAALGLLPWPPDLVISGINRGENMGQDITYSGTVTAAMEACIHHVPALAVSLASREADDPADYAPAAHLALEVAEAILANGLPAYSILNLNVPAGVVRGLRLTRQGIRIYRDVLEHAGDGVVRIAGDPPTGLFGEAGTDLWAVHHGFASLCPIHLDLTAHRLLADLSAWDLPFSRRQA
jgi:5'-nucleotidase